jgi:hypothetical protein
MKTLLSIALSAVMAISACFAGADLFTACTPAQAANVISTIEGYLTYAGTFIQVAEGIWAVLSPLLSASVAPAANVQFQKAITDLQDAQVAMEDGLQAAQIANSPNPNFATLIANCQSAVDEVVAAIAQYQTAPTTTKLGDSLSTLQHMQIQIHRWH